jgi:hypothetical protein
MRRQFVMLGLIATIELVSGLGSDASASGINVSVGYADSLRPNAYFPNPWNGSPDTIFAGNADGGYDAGAIMIANNTGAAITINDVSVTMPWNGHSWDLWGSHVVPVGWSLILTQTNGENFDTSDYATLTYPHTYPDGETAHATHVQIKLDGVLQSVLLDTGHVLTTGGSDPGGSGVNESYGWRPIGTFGGPPGVPEPASAIMALTAGAGGLGVACRRRFKARRQSA